MKSIAFFALLVFTWITIQPTAVLAKDPVKSSHMRNAIAHLEAAKTAKDSFVSLRTARRELIKAKSNKEGERKDAIELIDEAIAYATTGDRKTMLDKITKAIGAVKSGIARAK